MHMPSRLERFKDSFGGNSRRRSSNQIPNGTSTSSPNPPGTGSSLAPSSQGSPLSQSNSSSTSIPMNGAPGQQQQHSATNNADRPSSYPYSPRNPSLGPPQPPPQQGRPASPLPPPIQTPGQVPPPAGTGYPPQGHQMYGQPHGQPPPYPQGPPPPPPSSQQGGGGYGYSYGRGGAELDGGGRSKAQLIVGIDFVRSKQSMNVWMPRC